MNAGIIFKRGCTLAVAGMLVMPAAACTNTEAPGGTAAPAAKANVAGIGAGGKEAANSVQTDPAVAALLPADVRSNGTLRLVTDPTYAPMDYTDEQGNIVGLEPDMAVAVAKKMGLKAEISKGDFNGILAGIQSKRYDASWAAFSITPDRMAKVNMVSYLNGGTSVMVRKGETGIVNATDLCGMTVTAQTGTTQALTVLPSFQAACQAAGKPEIKPLLLPQQDSANQAVASNRAQAMLADAALVAYYAQEQPDAFQHVQSILVDPSLAGAVMAKESTELAAAFKAAVNSLMKDGTYATILNAWGLKGSAIPASEINPAPKA